ncbi:hypothetical protein BDZ45DRAFT_726670 [Acephala macrosclerotiorum]|nr:hypothetical protein BDZ45DRAFT_726670 [Acephala macrosclerotiorum]
METVYSMAYCTLAATSTSSSTDGFLNPRPQRKYLKIANGTGPPIYVCEFIDDFHRDVEKSVLNKRGWAYWECGMGVHCEALTPLFNPKFFILSDPEFPKYVKDYTSSTYIKTFQLIFEYYTQLNLTESTDKTIVFLGLHRRLAKDLGTAIRKSIVENFLHRSLLWQRVDEKLKRIPYPKDRKIPSFSWMAYQGRIRYTDFGYEDVFWNQKIRFPSEDVLEAVVREFQHCRIEERDLTCTVGIKQGMKEGGCGSMGLAWIPPH